MLILILVSVIVLASLQRYIAVKVWGLPEFSRGFQGDASVHFAIIRQLTYDPYARQIDNYLIAPEPMSYPTMFHHYARLYPLKTIQLKPWLPNFGLHLLFVSILTGWMWHLSNQSIISTVLSVITYLSMPSQWLFFGPAIAYLGLSERFLGRLACSASYLGFALGIVYDSPWLLALGTLFTVLALMSSIFARQALFFTIPLLSLLLLDTRPLLWLVLAVVIALALGRQHFLDGLRHTFLTWRLYSTHTKRSATVRRNLTGFFKWDQSQSQNFWSNLAINLWDKDPSRLFFWYPELLLSLLFFLDSNKAPTSLLITLFPPLIIYLITLTERFNHLGEAYRYLEYNFSLLIPIIIGLAYQGSIMQNRVLGIYILFAASFVVIRYFFRLHILRKQPSPEDEISQFITQTNIVGPAVIFPVSMRLGADIIARREDWKSFWWQPGIISELIYTDYVEEYPFLKRDWRPLAKRHGVTHIICDKRQDVQLKTWNYDFSDEELIFETPNFIAYRVRPRT